MTKIVNMRDLAYNAMMNKLDSNIDIVGKRITELENREKLTVTLVLEAERGKAADGVWTFSGKLKYKKAGAEEVDNIDSFNFNPDQPDMFNTDNGE